MPESSASLLTSAELYPAASVWAALAPLRAWFRPRFVGLEQLEGPGPFVFVANHTLFGTLDILTAAGLSEHAGIRPRGLHAPLYGHVPGWSGVLRRLGGVSATGENMRALLAAGESPLVCPGGLREVAKRRGEKYRLMWGDRVGWVRNAARHGAPLVPLATVGPEDAYTIVFDAGQIERSRVYAWAARRGLTARLPQIDGELLIPPLAWGLGPTPVPRPEPITVAVGEPIDTRAWRDRVDDKDAMLELRDEVRDRLAAEIDRLRRERSPRPSLVERVLGGRERELDGAVNR